MTSCPPFPALEAAIKAYVKAQQAHYKSPCWVEFIEESLVLSDSVYRSHIYIATSKRFPPRVASAYRRTFKAIVAIMTRYQR